MKHELDFSEDSLATIARYAAQSPLVKVIEQERWTGRADAINGYLAATTEAICVVVHNLS